MRAGLSVAFEGLSKAAGFLDYRDRTSLSRACRVLASHFRNDDDEDTTSVSRHYSGAHSQCRCRSCSAQLPQVALSEAAAHTLPQVGSDIVWHDAEEEWAEDEARRASLELPTDADALEDEAGVVSLRLSEAGPADDVIIHKPAASPQRKSVGAKIPNGLINSIVRKSGEYIKQMGLTDLWALPPKYWTEGDPTMFMLRGEKYLKDKVKVRQTLIIIDWPSFFPVRSRNMPAPTAGAPAATSLTALIRAAVVHPQMRAVAAACELAGVDVFDVPSPIFHMASHPRSFLRRVCHMHARSRRQLRPDPRLTLAADVFVHSG